MSTTRSPHVVPAASPAAFPSVTGRTTLAAVGVVTSVSLAGSLVAVATGLSASWWDAVGSGARLSVPLPMNVAMLLTGLLASTGRRRTAAVGASLLAVACTLAVVSGFFDGGYAAELNLLERSVQVTLVLSLAVTAAVAGRRVATALRRG